MPSGEASANMASSLIPGETSSALAGAAMIVELLAGTRAGERNATSGEVGNRTVLASTL